MSGTCMDINMTINRLIALDFDGTSAVYEPHLAMHSGLMDLIAELRGMGYSWVLNSDRYTDMLIEVALLLPPELRPDAVMSAQRFIHTRDGNGNYKPLQQWNDSRMELHNVLWKDISPCFGDWQQEIESEFTVCESVVNDLVFAYRVPAGENTALHKRMRGYIRPWRFAQLSGNHEWSFILHADFSKAALLEHYCEWRGIETQKIIAVGDGFNDISMLDAGMTPNMGCPADAGTEVIEVVRAGGGYVAGRSGPEGTIEVLQYYQGIMDV